MSEHDILKRLVQRIHDEAGSDPAAVAFALKMDQRLLGDIVKQEDIDIAKKFLEEGKLGI